MNQNTRKIAFSAMAIALATVTSMIKLLHMPLGGSVTLFSMFFITLIGYWYGAGTGLIAAVAYGLVQFVLGPEFYTVPQVIIDYGCAFGALGLSGVFSGKEDSRIKLLSGYALGVFGRYVFSVISGAVFFAEYAPDTFPNAWVYSAAYNGAYIGTEALITIVVMVMTPLYGAVCAVTKMARGE